MPPTITALAQVHLPVADIERSVAFYRDVLGLPLLMRVEAQRMAFLRCGETRLYLGEPLDGSPVAVGSVVLYLGVDDIAATWAELTGRVDVVSEPHVVHRDERIALWMAFFRDPDGQLLAISEERAHTT